MTAYFIRRFLLIIPTFLGITLAVFLIMQFVPGGPIERQIMSYQMALAQEGGGGGDALRLDSNIPEAAMEENRAYMDAAYAATGTPQERLVKVARTLCP